jgi:hypothetical protein
MNSRETVTFQELIPQQFETVRPLSAGFDSSLSIHAAIEGNSPGCIFVDWASSFHLTRSVGKHRPAISLPPFARSFWRSF